MYKLLYSFVYILSLLPWRFYYFLSDCLYYVLYYLIGYRKKVVLGNLAIAFPEKTEAERVAIAKEFYHNFLDNFLETIKLVSITEKEFRKRIVSNIEVINNLPQEVPNVSIVAAHFFNWEFANLAISLESKYPLITVYMPVANQAFDKLIYTVRKKFGAILIPSPKFRHLFHQYSQRNYSLGLVADQNPGNLDFAYWLPFFGKMVPFVKGPEKSSKSNGSAVVFLHFYKVKRGYYGFDYKLVTTDAKSYSNGMLTKELIRLTEDAIRKTPSNYLWSHRRSRHKFNEEKHGKGVVK